MFDSIISRKNTNAAKWEEAVYDTNSEDVIALSVADMDFQSSTEVINSIESAAKHGIYGYTNTSDEYFKAVHHWLLTEHSWDIPTDWIVHCPRIIQAISIIIQNNTNVGDEILIQTPLYSPLRKTIELNNRIVVENPLAYEKGKYVMDFTDLEDKFSRGVKVMILCSPHNPVGRVWDEEELKKLAELCAEYNVLIISDEVHADFTWGKPHTTIGEMDAIKDQIFVCTSPGKTFNLPGLEISNIIIPNKELRENFKLNLQQLGFHNPNYFVESALKAAYNNSSEWLISLKEYLYTNFEFVNDFLEKHLPAFNVVNNEGTYLMWIDYRECNLTEEEIKQWFFDHAKVAVSLGSSFGKEGIGFIRLNIALPRKTLEEALNRILATKTLF